MLQGMKKGIPFVIVLNIMIKMKEKKGKTKSKLN
jgi:hypothetical protein